MTTEDVMSGTGIDAPAVKDTIQPEPLPAPGADDQKPTVPASDADAQKTESAETPEQQEAKKESRRSRSNARKVQQLADARAEAKLLREQLTKLEAQQQQPQPDAAPKRDQFDDYEAYLRAVTKHDAEQAATAVLKTDSEKRELADKQKSDTAGQEKLAKDWSEREQTFLAATKDYIEAVTPFIEDELGSFSEVARRAIAESEVGPQLLYHLSKNPEDAERIADMSPVRQVAELGKIETRLDAPLPGKKVSAAPAPITPAKAGSSAPQGFSENMSDVEYKSWRKTHGARWAR